MEFGKLQVVYSLQFFDNIPNFIKCIYNYLGSSASDDVTTEVPNNQPIGFQLMVREKLETAEQINFGVYGW